MTGSPGWPWLTLSELICVTWSLRRPNPHCLGPKCCHRRRTPGPLLRRTLQKDKDSEPEGGRISFFEIMVAFTSFHPACLAAIGPMMGSSKRSLL